MNNVLSGTADINNGSDVITVHGMAPLTAANVPGDSGLQLNGRGYFVDTVLSTTTLRLTRQVAEASATVPCEISPYTAQTVATTTLNIRTAAFIAALGAIEGTGIQPNAVGDFADRATYDTQTDGFVFLSLDGDGALITAPVLFAREGDTAGVWSEAIFPKGDKGEPGIVGDEYAVDIGANGGNDLSQTGLYPAALSARSAGLLTRLYGSVAAGSGSVTVQVLVNGTVAIDSQIVAAGSPVTIDGQSIDIAEGDRIDFALVSITGSVQWLWLQLDGPVNGGAVSGPTSAVDTRLAAFDGTSGKLLKDSGVTLDTDGTLAANSDARVPTQKAVNTFGATKLSTAGGTMTGNLKAVAGSNAVAPLTLQSGAVKTAAAAGDIEFDGKAFYATSAAGARQALVAEQISVLAADFVGSNVNTAQPVFSSGQDVLAVQASTTYAFEAEYEIDTTGTTSHALGILFALGGGASLTGIAYRASATNGSARGTPSTPAVSRFEAATVSTVTAAVAAATQNTVSLRGTIRVNAAGTITPQFQYSAAPGAAPTIRANSFFRLWPIGSDTVAAVGSWS